MNDSLMVKLTPNDFNIAFSRASTATVEDALFSTRGFRLRAWVGRRAGNKGSSLL